MSHIRRTLRGSGGYGRVVAAELVKARSLPAIAGTVLGCVAVAIIIVAALAAAPPPDGEGIAREADAVALTLRAVAFLQAGTILLGVLTGAGEYSGGQIRTTVTACPNRLVVLTGRGVAHLIVSTAAGAVALGAGLSTATLLGAGSGLGAADGRWRLAGAVAYLALVGLLSHAVAVTVRGVATALTGMLAVVYVVSPVLVGLTRHAWLLPDRAGQLLYAGSADLPAPGVGLLVGLGWVAVTWVAATVTFLRRDV